VNTDNVSRCVKLRGRPYSITKGQVIEFFRDFDVSAAQITLDTANGKNTGYAIVELANAIVAQQAV